MVGQSEKLASVDRVKMDLAISVMLAWVMTADALVPTGTNAWVTAGRELGLALAKNCIDVTGSNEPPVSTVSVSDASFTSFTSSAVICCCSNVLSE